MRRSLLILFLGYQAMLGGVPDCQSIDVAPAQPNSKLRILILSGQNNHDWRTTTPVLESCLTNTGRFTVSITEHPEKYDQQTFHKYDALLSNWNSWGLQTTNAWPAATRDAFLSFVRSGRGLVVVHAGGSSFPEWQEYQDLIGGTWGPETGHGTVHEFQVKITAPFHPITQGLPDFTITDELWHRMAVRPSRAVLATAFSSADRGGSGHDEPVAFVTHFGRGRCFNLVLGHDVRAMTSPGFQLLLCRGIEWAAIGRVTLPAQPAAIPAPKR